MCCLVDGRTHTNSDSHDDGINVAQVLSRQENEQLKRRIEKMTNRIQILIHDKERLLEISNHLRAQVHRHEGDQTNCSCSLNSIRSY
jgi:hypothetical protein